MTLDPRRYSGIVVDAGAHVLIGRPNSNNDGHDYDHHAIFGGTISGRTLSSLRTQAEAELAKCNGTRHRQEVMVRYHAGTGQTKIDVGPVGGFPSRKAKT